MYSMGEACIYYRKPYFSIGMACFCIGKARFSIGHGHVCPIEWSAVGNEKPSEVESFIHSGCVAQWHSYLLVRDRRIWYIEVVVSGIVVVDQFAI